MITAQEGGLGEYRLANISKTRQCRWLPWYTCATRQRAARKEEVRMVKQIVELSIDSEADRLRYFEALANVKIRPRKTRRTKLIPSGISNLTVLGVCNWKTGSRACIDH